jgi:hypothetical protein
MVGDMVDMAVWSGAPADVRAVTPVAEDQGEATQGEATEVVAMEVAEVVATEVAGTEATRAKRRPQVRLHCKARRSSRRVFLAMY